MSLKSVYKSVRYRLRLWQKFRDAEKGNRSVYDLSPFERGVYYEEKACRWLKERNYHILDRNYRGRKRRELDIVAKDGETLVFIEVKARREGSRYTPLSAIDKEKCYAISQAAKDYLRALELTGIDVDDLDVRYDAVAVEFDKQGNVVTMKHYISYLEERRETV